MTSDLDLLRQFAQENSQDAFGEIVRRYLDLVYSAALRQVRSPQLAEDVAQSVFVDLARDAHKLKPDTVLTAWLYAVARRTAIDTVRKESRRQLREQIAVEMNAMNATANDWEQIAPLLDDAMAALDETDRAAVLLRYFENKSLRDVGESLKISDDAAQKRVSRAIESLREFFSKQRLAVGAGALVTVISANAVQSAPVGLAASISTAAVLAGTAVQASSVITATKTIAMTTLQKSIVVVALAAAAGTGIYSAQRNSELRNEIQTLQQQLTPLTAQIQQLQQERDEATNQLANLVAENARQESGTNESELLRLRGEVTRLENEANDPTSVAAKALIDKVNRLKQRFEQNPGAKIPEFQFLTDKDWFNAANHNLNTDTDYRKAMAAVRNAAEEKFAGMLEPALSQYMHANNGQFPTDLSQLQSYFSSPVDDAILQRWEITSPKTVPNIGVGSKGIITEAAPVDEIFDSRIAVGEDGYGTADYADPAEQKLVGQAYKAYQAANNGLNPPQVSDLLPYATTPAQQTAIQNAILRQSE